MDKASRLDCLQLLLDDMDTLKTHVHNRYRCLHDKVMRIHHEKQCVTVVEQMRDKWGKCEKTFSDVDDGETWSNIEGQLIIMLKLSTIMEYRRLHTLVHRATKWDK